MLCVKAAAVELLRFALLLAAAADLGAQSETGARSLHGFRGWLLSVHHEHRFLYALLSVAVMAALGALLAVSIELVLKRLGLGTRQLEHRE